LHSKADFPESASNNEWARYLYYLGRIQAIQLDYSSAQRNLVQAIRKAPQQSAIGFKQMVSELTEIKCRFACLSVWSVKLLQLLDLDIFIGYQVVCHCPIVTWRDP
jgi:hypothetical protein